ncbi:hypothetical protein MN608_00117 [Microdochium nivale]|nr:hypothetical protein MN608_00117 [Microdochium nivale]
MADQSNNKTNNSSASSTDPTGLNRSRWAPPELRILKTVPKPLFSGSDGGNELHVARTRAHQPPVLPPNPSHQSVALSIAAVDAVGFDMNDDSPVKPPHLPESKLLWAIMSGCDSEQLRQIGAVCEKVNPAAFKSHYCEIAPTPFTACFMHDNLDALRYLIDEVDNAIFDIERDVSEEDLLNCIKIAFQEGLDDILLYLISEVDIDPAGILTPAARLAQHGMALCLYWRLSADSAGNSEPQQQALMLECLEKAVQADSARRPDNHAVVEVLLDLGGPQVCRSSAMLEYMVIAVVSDRMREASAMFSAWQHAPSLHESGSNSSGDGVIKHRTVLTLYCFVRDRDSASDGGKYDWILDVLEHHFPWFLPPVHGVDDDVFSDDGEKVEHPSDSDFEEISEDEANEYAEHLRMGELQAAGLAGDIPIAVDEWVAGPRLRAIAHADDGYEADVDCSTH